MQRRAMILECKDPAGQPVVETCRSLEYSIELHVSSICV